MSKYTTFQNWSLLILRLMIAVIFFCGAGVSMPAGLDSFWALTNRIIDTLSATKARKALADKESFDRVFNVLVREFGRAEIDSQIYTALGVGKPRTLKHHRDILALSRGASGNPQIVTTNFDRLFEQAGRDVHPEVGRSRDLCRHRSDQSYRREDVGNFDRNHGQRPGLFTD